MLNTQNNFSYEMLDKNFPDNKNTIFVNFEIDASITIHYCPYPRATAGGKDCEEGKNVQADWPFGYQLWACEVQKS